MERERKRQREKDGQKVVDRLEYTDSYKLRCINKYRQIEIDRYVDRYEQRKYIWIVIGRYLQIGIDWCKQAEKAISRLRLIEI